MGVLSVPRRSDAGLVWCYFFRFLAPVGTRFFSFWSFNTNVGPQPSTCNTTRPRLTKKYGHPATVPGHIANSEPLFEDPVRHVAARFPSVSREVQRSHVTSFAGHSATATYRTMHIENRFLVSLGKASWFDTSTCWMDIRKLRNVVFSGL